MLLHTVLDKENLAIQEARRSICFSHYSLSLSLSLPVFPLEGEPVVTSSSAVAVAG